MIAEKFGHWHVGVSQKSLAQDKTQPALLACDGNQVGPALPLYVAVAAAERLNVTHSPEKKSG